MIHLHSLNFYVKYKISLGAINIWACNLQKKSTQKIDDLNFFFIKFYSKQLSIEMCISIRVSQYLPSLFLLSWHPRDPFQYLEYVHRHRVCPCTGTNSGGFACSNEYFVLLARWCLLLPQDLQNLHLFYHRFRVTWFKFMSSHKFALILSVNWTRRQSHQQRLFHWFFVAHLACWPCMLLRNACCLIIQSPIKFSTFIVVFSLKFVIKFDNGKLSR